MMRVYFDMPGVKKIGDYEREKIYEVDDAEAQRLIEAKGFKDADKTETVVEE